MVVSSNAGTAFDDIAATGVHWWLQAYLPSDRTAALPLLERAVAAGAAAVVLTVDTPVVATKYAVQRAEVERAHPGLVGVNHVDPASTGTSASIPRPGLEKALDLGPQDLDWLAETTGLPAVVKGVLRPDDAVRCVQAGASAVWVSNHGGRQLDRAEHGRGAALRRRRGGRPGPGARRRGHPVRPRRGHRAGTGCGRGLPGAPCALRPGRGRARGGPAARGAGRSRVSRPCVSRAARPCGGPRADSCASRPAGPRARCGSASPRLDLRARRRSSNVSDVARERRETRSARSGLRPRGGHAVGFIRTRRTTFVVATVRAVGHQHGILPETGGTGRVMFENSTVCLVIVDEINLYALIFFGLGLFFRQ